MNSEEAISDQHSAISSETGDPLADAHCLHCGYSLRGLPENRCPECGTAFDPAVFAAPFLPRWPRLLKWYLVALAAAWFVNYSDALLLVRTVGSQKQMILVSGTIWLFCEAVSMVLLGLASAIGLDRGRDWARRLCIFMLLTLCGCRVARWLPMFGPWIGAGSLTSLISFVWQMTHTLWPLALVVFLVTGLRRCSLARKSGQPRPLLPRNRFRIRRDWLLLLVLLLVLAGIQMLTLALVEWTGLVRLLPLQPPLPYVAQVLVLSLSALVCVVGPVAIWCRPSWGKPFLTGLALLLPCTALLKTVSLAELYTRLGRPLTLANLAPTACQAISEILPTLTLCLFVLVGVSRAQIHEVEQAGRNRKAARGW